jgi:ribonuclease J
MSHPHPELGSAAGASRGRPARRRPRRPRRGRPQHDRLRVRRPAADRRLRRALPRGDQPGVDLILPTSTSIRDRLDDVEALVLTHGHEDHIGAVPYLLRERGDIPLVGSKLTLALLEAKLQGAPDQADHPPRGQRGRPELVRPVRPASSSRSTTRSPTRSPSRSAPAPAWCCTPATSRWTSCRSTAGSPTCARSPGSARRASTCFLTDSTNAEVPGFTTPSATSPGPRPGLPRPAPSASSSPASPATCTASSRCSTPRSHHGRKVAFVGRSMVRNMGIARDLGYLTSRRAVVDAKELETCRTTRSC